ncbi:MAG: threonylcarbamoyl-AMP synthase [Candidatus Altiarchaeales archaeon IMC4]|nr:MAG: threonylcarbamoyl-AMP synthase [Candidatus Altiarchaeales archaeon IMC4]
MMNVIRINSTSPEESAVMTTAEILKKGGIIVYPTDTVYGIGCMIETPSVERIFQIKKKPRSPLSVAFSDVESAEKFVYMSGQQRAFIEEHQNEPYTFILKAKDNVPERVASGTLGIRIPDCLFVRKITKLAGPIITTSANTHRGPPPSDFAEIEKGILASADLAIDGGRCKFGRPSRIIDLTTNEVLRE